MSINTNYNEFLNLKNDLIDQFDLAEDIIIKLLPNLKKYRRNYNKQENENLDDNILKLKESLEFDNCENMNDFELFDSDNLFNDKIELDKSTDILNENNIVECDLINPTIKEDDFNDEYDDKSSSDSFMIDEDINNNKIYRKGILFDENNVIHPAKLQDNDEVRKGILLDEDSVIEPNLLF